MSILRLPAYSLLAMALATGAISCTTSRVGPAVQRKAESNPIPVLEVTDLAGKKHSPLNPNAAQSRGSVLLFLATECPISNAYSPEIGRMCDAYQAKGFAFYIVYSDPELSAASAREHVEAYGYSCPAVLDSDHRLARAVGATVTPEVALVSSTGKVAYLGRIDNLYAALGRRRFQATTHELRDAMDAELSGAHITRPRTEAIGCQIPGITTSENKS